MSDIITLQDNTAFDAADLNGTPVATKLYQAWLIWFDTTLYDGTATWEFSPDGGTTWLGIEAVALSNSTTLVTSKASPADTDAYLIHVPSHGALRVRMSGGSAGSLYVYGRGVNFNR